MKIRVWDQRYNKYLEQFRVDNLLVVALKDYQVEQFTGLTDKNGKDIYVGDIVDIHQTVNGQNLFIIENEGLFINVKYALIDRYYEYDIKELLDFNIQDKEIEVIGNINENKELLENEKFSTYRYR